MIKLPVWPTRRGWFLLCISAAALLNALINPNLASFMFAAGLCSLVGASLALCSFSLRKIGLKREIGRDASRNGTALLPLSVHNAGAFPRQAIVIRELEKFTGLDRFDTVVDPLLPGESRLVPRRPVARRRGRFLLDEVLALGGDPAGLFRRMRRFKLPSELLVRSDKERIAWMPIRIKGRLQTATSGRAAGAAGFGQDFFGVREHRPQDGVRFIHWKASAKQGKLMVKEFEEQEIPQVSILLDCCAEDVGLDEFDSNFEALVRIAASMSDYLGGLYCRMAFITGPRDDGKEPSIETGLAFSLRRDIVELLTDIKPSKATLLELLDTSLEVQQPGSILYILSMSAPEGIEERLNALFDADVEVRWILAPKELYPHDGEESVAKPKLKIPDTLRPQPLICSPKTKLSSLLEHD